MDSYLSSSADQGRKFSGKTILVKCALFAPFAILRASFSMIFQAVPRSLTILIALLIGAGSTWTHAGETATIFSRLKFNQAVKEGVTKADKTSNMTVAGTDNWLFLDKELKHLAAPKFWSTNATGSPAQSEPLPVILDFKDQLDKAGVDLLVVPVPTKASIYPDKLSPSAPTFSVQTPLDLAQNDREFCKLLASNGVKVLDLTETFLTARYACSPDLYCKQDTHWAPPGIQLAAKKILEQIKDLPWVKSQPKMAMKSEESALEFIGDLASALPTPSVKPERVIARYIGLADVAGIQPLPNAKESPIILLGDSHNLVFHSGGDMHATAAGLPDQLAFELGFPLDVVAVKGSGATPARRNLARRKDNLVGRKLVIWCFSSREFTEGQGWAKVQLVKDSENPQH